MDFHALHPDIDTFASGEDITVTEYYDLNPYPFSSAMAMFHVASWFQSN